MQETFEQAALAIFTGDIEAFDQILHANPGVASHRAENGHPNLLQLVACEEQHIANPSDFAERLIDAGSPTAGPLVAAAGCSGLQTLTTILERGEPVDTQNEWTPLDEAIYWVNPDIVRMLLDRGASRGRLRRAAALGDVDAVQSFFSGSTLQTSAGPIASPFDYTVDDATKDDPQTIIDHAFVMAVNSGQRSTAEWLLDRGATINAAPPGYHWKGTALHAAVWRGEVELVQWLLDSGSDPAIHDGLADADALGWAHHHNQDAIVVLLEGRS